MDPNALLDSLRQLLVHANKFYGQTSPIADVYDQFEELDKWLSGGGRLPEDWARCLHGHPAMATCGECGHQWCDTCDPVPSARCPVEYDHDEG